MPKKRKKILFLRMKVRENIAVTHIFMGQYAEAAQVYEIVMQERPSYRSGLNLLLCYYTIGENVKTRRVFTDLLKLPYPSSNDDYSVSVNIY